MKRLILLLSTLMLSLACTQAAQFDANRGIQVTLKTNVGAIVVQLDPRAPISSKNFLDHVEKGFYNGTVFHRVIPGFMAQGGGFDAELNKKPTGAPIANESGNGISNVRGTLAMARTNDPHSATSQFFINVSDNPNLNTRPGRWGYAVFGKVVSGMDIVDTIVNQPTHGAGTFSKDVPKKTMIIEEAFVVKQRGAKSAKTSTKR